MKREQGFSVLEMMVSTAILISVVGAAISALVQAQKVTQGVALMANAQENLRAGMHMMVADLNQAGVGIPQGGISIPLTSGASAMKRPGTGATSATMTTFPTTWTVLPAVAPGPQLGQAATTVNPNTNATLTGINTDIINILYEDTTLEDVHGYYLNSYPVVQASPATPVCAGTIASNGSSVVVAPACFTFPTTAPYPLAVGNLIMFSNTNGTALEYVTAINTTTQTLTFGSGDPAGLNTTANVPGSVSAIMSGSPATTITRVWMVTYYVDATTNPSRPQLVRQVNYPAYPTATPANPPQDVGDAIEDLGFTYDITDSTAPAASYAPATPGDAPEPVLPDTPAQIRAVNVFLAARSETAYTGSSAPQFFRNNLTTQVCLRSLAFEAPFSTSAGSPPVP